MDPALVNTSRISLPRVYLFLWPGLPQLWCRGSWTGLLLAASFAMLLNTVLATTVVWTEWASAAVGRIGWLLVACFWAVSAAVSWRWWPHQAIGRYETPDGDLYREALSEYLRADWFKAETQCRELLRRNPRDVDAHLLLATLLRRTGRLSEAAQRLTLLSRLDNAVKWQMEIEHEQDQLAEAEAEAVRGAVLRGAFGAADPLGEAA